jgi:hypothetical protein
MRTLVVLTFAGLCLGALAGSAEENKVARQLLDRAIDALGGLELLQKEKAITGTSEGTVHINNKANKVRNEWSVQGLDQLKWSSEVTIDDKSLSVVLVMNAKKAWIRVAGASEAAEPGAEQVALFRPAIAGLRLAESPHLLRDRAYQLSPLGELKVGDRPAVGIKVCRKGMPDLDLYFDKVTHLPVQAQMRLQEQPGREVTWTAQMGDYVKQDGRQRFTRLTIQRDDQVVIEMKRSNIKSSTGLDASTFEKP